MVLDFFKFWLLKCDNNMFIIGFLFRMIILWFVIINCYYYNKYFICFVNLYMVCDICDIILED